MQVNNEKVKEKSEGKGVGKVGESFVQAAAPNVQAELSNEATPGKIVFEEVVLEAAIEAEDHVKKSEAAQAEAAKLQRDSPLALDSDKLKKEQETVASDKEVGVEAGDLITEPLTKEAEPLSKEAEPPKEAEIPEEAVKVGVAVDEGASNTG